MSVGPARQLDPSMTYGELLDAGYLVIDTQGAQPTRFDFRSPENFAPGLTDEERRGSYDPDAICVKWCGGTLWRIEVGDWSMRTVWDHVRGCWTLEDRGSPTRLAATRYDDLPQALRQAAELHRNPKD